MINILGLSIGISAALVIYLVVSYDFSFDKNHKDGDRIYRIVTRNEFSGEVYDNSGVPSPMGPAVSKEVTGIDLTCAFRTWSDVKVSIPTPGKTLPVVFKKQDKLVYASESYFKLIDYQWLAGSPATALQEPYEVVLTESNAALYFPGLKPSDITGRKIYFDDTTGATITGIVKNLPYNTDFTFNIFISTATLDKTSLKPYDWDRWDNTNSASQLFVKLSPGVATAQIEKQALALLNKNDRRKPGEISKAKMLLQPLSDIHFNDKYDNFDQRLAHKPTLYGLLAVAAFLLLLGCINFINLSTAQASQRAKETGIRKTMGSTRQQLVTQYLSETFLITLFATVVSIALTPLLLKLFADFIPDGVHFNLLKQPAILLFLLGLIITVSLLSGFYPAVILAAYKPVLALKNQAYRNSGQTRSAWLRKSLTVSQFVIAQVFIIATILVGKQIHYSLTKDLGYKKDAIVFFSTSWRDNNKSNKALLVEKLKTIPGIAVVSLSNFPPSSHGTWSSVMKYKDGKKELENDVQVKLGDTNYINVYNLKLVAGNNLAASDTLNGVLINQTYARLLGFKEPQQAIGKYIEWDNRTPIVGVIADFHQKSLHEPIKPLVIGTKARQMRTVNIALQPQLAGSGTWKTAIAKIEKAWKEIYPEEDFEYSFFDESIKKYYVAEQNTSQLLMWATGLTIFISCLGLMGLVIYITNQRTKEIGVRKVIGASVVQIVTLLSKDFMKLVLIAFVIAVPIAWWGAGKWLENFAYRTSISWWIFAGGGAVMFVIAAVILGIRTFKAATANPVMALRSE